MTSSGVALLSALWYAVFTSAKAHGGVHRLAIEDGSTATAVADVCGDDLGVGCIYAQVFAYACRNIAV